jgi:hypothetical protein
MIGGDPVPTSLRRRCFLLDEAMTIRLAKIAAAAVAALLLAGCGGGISLGYTWVDDPDYIDAPPVVQMSPLPPVVQVGGTLRLGAAAADEDGIDEVAFYRIDGPFATFLGADQVPPYQVDTVIPGDRFTVSYFARAFDRAGRRTDSAVVSADVVP